MLHYQILMALCYLFLISTLKKKKYICSNNCSFMTKELRKAIMNRSKLRNKFLKTRNEESRRRFNRQRNFCVSLLRKTKRRFSGKQDHKVISDNSKFWKTVGPLFSEKAFHKESIILSNNNNITSSDVTDPVFNAIKSTKIIQM